MKKSSTSIITLLLGTGLGGGVASPALSQSTDAVVSGSEIVVTAQRREEKLLDVPISITAISGEGLQEAGVRNTQDLSYYVPSLTVSKVSPGFATLAIRGLGSEFGNSSLTGIYLDEAAVSADAISQIDLIASDLQRVEVLKGPQGTLYGEGSTGGTIRFITNKPNLAEPSGSLNLSVSDTRDGGIGQEATGVLNLPLAQDRLGIRIAAYVENGAGWIDRPETGQKDINDNKLVDVRTIIRFKPVQELDILATAIIHRNDAGASNIVNLEPRSESNFRAAIDPTAPQDIDDDYELYNLTANYDFGSVSLLSSTSYVDSSRQMLGQSQIGLFDLGVVGEYEVLARDWRTDAEIFTQELRLASSGNTALEWTLGGYYRSSKIITDRTSDVAFAGTSFGTFYNIGLNGSKSWALFGDVSYSLTEQLRAGVGFRYFEDKRRARNVNTAGMNLEDAQLFTGKFTAFSPRLYISFTPTPTVNIYASRSEGFRSGGFNSAAAVASGAPSTYDPEDLTAYEVGAKGSLFDGVLDAEIALFYNRYSDIQFQGIQTIAGSPLGFIGNVGKGRIKGIDWALRLHPVKGLTLTASGDVIDTKITSIRATGTAQIVGDPIDFVAKYTLSFTGEYRAPLSDSVTGYARLAYNQKGRATQTYRDIGLADFQDRSSELNILDGAIGTEIGSVTVGLFARNLLDDRGKVRPGITRWHAQLRPRTFGLELNAKF